MISADKLKICYEDFAAVRDFCLTVVPGEILSIIGPNGSGKSSVLRVLARLYPKKEGAVYLGKADMATMKSKHIARVMSIVSQYQTPPPDITVEELVAKGRIPHHSLFSGLSSPDREVIRECLEQTRLWDYRDRSIYSLSGGERQRAFIAMALAQQPALLLLDEPTTYLDISYQFEVLELIKALNRRRNLTIVMVLHDINQAARYSHRLAVMHRGALFKVGTPGEILTEDLIRQVYRMDARILHEDCTGCPYIIPLGIAAEVTDHHDEPALGYKV